MSQNGTNPMDWLHCNNCYKIQPQMGPVFFWSCGHILCQKCSYNNDLNCPQTACTVCKRSAKCIPVDKNMNTDMRMYFRTPHDVASHCMQQLKKVLDFQSAHRFRLNKWQHERAMKVQKYAEGSGAQLKKTQETAKKLHVEKQQILEENLKYKQEIQDLTARNRKLEARLREKEHQLAVIQSPNRLKRGNSDSGMESFPSSQFSDFSFNATGFLTSTPVQGSSPIAPRLLSSTPLPDLFQAVENNLSPIAQDPNIFGKVQKRNSGPRPGSDFVFKSQHSM